MDPVTPTPMGTPEEMANPIATPAPEMPTPTTPVAPAMDVSTSEPTAETVAQVPELQTWSAPNVETEPAVETPSASAVVEPTVVVPSSDPAAETAESPVVQPEVPTESTPPPSV